jgi:hypothetical protein
MTPDRTRQLINTINELGSLLDGFQADFSFLLRSGFADPDDAAALGAGWVFIEDKFNFIAGSEAEASAQPESSFREIEDKTGEPHLAVVQIDDQAGTSLRHLPPRAAGVETRKARHSINLWSEGSGGTPGLLSF